MRIDCNIILALATSNVAMPFSQDLHCIFIQIRNLNLFLWIYLSYWIATENSDSFFGERCISLHMHFLLKQNKHGCLWDKRDPATLYWKELSQKKNVIFGPLRVILISFNFGFSSCEMASIWLV